MAVFMFEMSFIGGDLGQKEGYLGHVSFVVPDVVKNNSLSEN